MQKEPESSSGKIKVLTAVVERVNSPFTVTVVSIRDNKPFEIMKCHD